MNYPAPPAYPPGYPPQQVQPTQPQYPTYPPQQVAPQFPGYPPQQQAPAAPLAAGTLDEYYGQPSAGGGPSLSWKDKPIGTQYAGIVARDVTNADVQQQTDFQTKQPLFYRDGRPKFAMKVPLKVHVTQEHPDGEAVWFVKGQARDELVRAMAEAGVSGAPKAGDGIVITLVQRKASGQGLNPTNVFQVQYHPAQQGQPGPEAASPAPVPPQPAAAPPAPAPAAPQPEAQAPAAPPPPANLDPAQQELLAKLTGGQQA